MKRSTTATTTTAAAKGSTVPMMVMMTTRMKGTAVAAAASSTMAVMMVVVRLEQQQQRQTVAGGGEMTAAGCRYTDMHTQSGGGRAEAPGTLPTSVLRPTTTTSAIGVPPSAAAPVSQSPTPTAAMVLTPRAASPHTHTFSSAKSALTRTTLCLRELFFPLHLDLLQAPEPVSQSVSRGWCCCWCCRLAEISHSLRNSFFFFFH